MSLSLGVYVCLSTLSLSICLVFVIFISLLHVFSIFSSFCPIPFHFWSNMHWTSGQCTYRLQLHSFESIYRYYHQSYGIKYIKRNNDQCTHTRLNERCDQMFVAPLLQNNKMALTIYDGWFENWHILNATILWKKHQSLSKLKLNLTVTHDVFNWNWSRSWSIRKVFSQFLQGRKKYFVVDTIVCVLETVTFNCKFVNVWIDKWLASEPKINCMLCCRRASDIIFF